MYSTVPKSVKSLSREGQDFEYAQEREGSSLCLDFKLNLFLIRSTSFLRLSNLRPQSPGRQLYLFLLYLHVLSGPRRVVWSFRFSDGFTCDLGFIKDDRFLLH